LSFARYKIRIVDNGRGIPVDKHKQQKVSALETYYDNFARWWKIWG